jgi:spoIIIJ-associated protein
MNQTKEPTMTDAGAEFPLLEQEEVVRGFLADLVTSFGLVGTIDTRSQDGVVHGVVNGEGLGLLIGPRGGTLRAVQELAWTTLQRAAGGRDCASVRVDVGGFVERRRAALEQFARAQAAEVVATGVARALEPMSSPDRKIVHDALVGVEGVRTISEGDDPRRRVVVLPD